MVWFIDIDTQLALQGDNASLEKQLKEKKEENQRLKSLLKDLRKLIGNNFLNHEMRILLNEIDEVLK